MLKDFLRPFLTSLETRFHKLAHLKDNVPIKLTLKHKPTTTHCTRQSPSRSFQSWQILRHAKSIKGCRTKALTLLYQESSLSDSSGSQKTLIHKWNCFSDFIQLWTGEQADYHSVVGCLADVLEAKTKCPDPHFRRPCSSQPRSAWHHFISQRITTQSNFSHQYSS